MENSVNKTVSFYNKSYLVAMKSENTNNFGLYQMIVVSRDGEAYKLHASMYNVKKKGEYILESIKSVDGKVVSSTFKGCEIPIKLSQVPKEVLNELFQ